MLVTCSCTDTDCTNFGGWYFELGTTIFLCTVTFLHTMYFIPDLLLLTWQTVHCIGKLRLHNLFKVVLGCLGIIQPLSISYKSTHRSTIFLLATSIPLAVKLYMYLYMYMYMHMVLIISKFTVQCIMLMSRLIEPHLSRISYLYFSLESQE